MIEFEERLSPLIQKEPIVSTFDSHSIREQPEAVIASYEQHASTYIALSPVRNIEQRFIERILQRETPKACLIAQYGYGKTTAAIGIWQSCIASGILAVPPASYASFLEIAAATYTWTQRCLSHLPGALDELEEAYRTYLQSSTEELARIVSQRSDHSFEQVLSVLTDPALGESLRLNPPATNMVLFLQVVTQISCSHGYAGVAIFVDEFQQLLGKANPEILTALRSLIWGLRTRKIALGLLITMDPNSERTLSDRAGDILHRIKDDDLYLDFRQIYNSDFPRLLWERYAQQLGLDGLTFTVVDKPTLEALGQISERGDLSNGPRTIANAFRRIASFYASTGKTYTPMQLIDDFLAGIIIFDGDAGTIASLVAELSAYAYFRRSEAHLTVLKLLAAFPRGCSANVAKSYGVLDIFEEVTAELRGEIVTLLPEGNALIDLQRVGKPIDKLSLILKKYWMQITDAGVDEDETCRRFAQHVLPLLFPTATDRSGTWAAATSLQMFADGTYRQSFRGSLHDRHPDRRVRAIVCRSQPIHLTVEPDEEADLTLVLTLLTQSGHQASQAAATRGRIDFDLDMARVPEAGLPPELRVVEHNLSPQPSTPAVLLNVIEFVTREMADLTLTPPERQRFDRMLDRMRQWVLTQLFNESLLGAVDPEAATPGQRGIRDLLFRECERRYPRYRTMITSSNWRHNLVVYRQALAAVTMSQRRGVEPLVGPKAALAVLFGQRSHAGFESKARVQYPHLLDIAWSGEQGTLRFLAHPMEAQLLAHLGDMGRTHDAAVALARGEGYTREEADELLDLLAARGQTRKDGDSIRKAATMTVAEMRRLGTAVLDELRAFQHVLVADCIAAEQGLAEAIVGVAVDDDEAQIRAHSQLVLLLERLGGLRTQARKNLLALLEEQREEVTNLLRNLDTPLAPCTADVTFRNHLEGARKQIEERRLALQRSLVRLREAIQRAREDAVRIQDTEIAHHLAAVGDGISQRGTSLAALRPRTQELVRRFELYHQCSTRAEQLARLRENMRDLVGWSDVDTSSVAHLASRLTELESNARERLAQGGLRTLNEYDDWMRDRLESLAQEYERSFRERDVAFDREKAELETLVSALAESQPRLVSKYQSSKHAESYRDLYAEAASIAVSIVRTGLLQAQHLKKSNRVRLAQGPGDASTTQEKRALTLCISELNKVERLLSASDWSSSESRRAMRETLLARATDNVSQIRRALAQMNIQADLWTADGQVAAGVTSSSRDVTTLINVQEALSLLPSTSPLGTLLRLCLDGELIMEVRRNTTPNNG